MVGMYCYNRNTGGGSSICQSTHDNQRCKVEVFAGSSLTEVITVQNYYKQCLLLDIHIRFAYSSGGAVFSCQLWAAPFFFEIHL